MASHLRARGHAVSEKRIRRLTRRMGLMPIYQHPNISLKAKDHETWPYLLRGLVITWPNQVWCADVTCIPMRRGFLDLVAMMDWATRKVLAWRLAQRRQFAFEIRSRTMTGSPLPPDLPLVRALREVREILEHARKTGDRHKIERAIERINRELDRREQDCGFAVMDGLRACRGRSPVA